MAEAQLARVSEPRADSAARSELYRVLSAAFRHPNPAAPSLGRTLVAVAAALPYRLPEMTLHELPLAELQLHLGRLAASLWNYGASFPEPSKPAPTPCRYSRASPGRFRLRFSRDGR